MMNNLHSQTVCLLPKHLITIYGEIDILVGNIMENEKHQCRKLHKGNIPCSPALQNMPRTTLLENEKRGP